MPTVRNFLLTFAQPNLLPAPRRQKYYEKPITTLILLICASIAAAQISQANLALLDSLDTALEQSGQYEAAKAAQLERATRHAAAITEPEEKILGHT